MFKDFIVTWLETNNKNNEQVVSKMEKMTPKERANHDLKLSFFQKAREMSKEKETPMQEASKDESKEK